MILYGRPCIQFGAVKFEGPELTLATKADLTMSTKTDMKLSTKVVRLILLMEFLFSECSKYIYIQTEGSFSPFWLISILSC